MQVLETKEAKMSVGVLAMKAAKGGLMVVRRLDAEPT